MIFPPLSIIIDNLEMANHSKNAGKVFLNIFLEFSRDLFKNFIKIFQKPFIIYPLFSQKPKNIIKIFIIICQNFLRISKIKNLQVSSKYSYTFGRFFKNVPRFS